MLCPKLLIASEPNKSKCQFPGPAENIALCTKPQGVSIVIHYGVSKPKLPARKKAHRHVGSDFEEFLKEDKRLEAATAHALKRVLAWEFQQAMEKANVSQAEMARRMHTSRAVIRRLLDEDDPSITLSTISKAANALGKNLRLKLAA